MHDSMCKRQKHNALERKTYRGASKWKRGGSGGWLEHTPQYKKVTKRLENNIAETTFHFTND